MRAILRFAALLAVGLTVVVALPTHAQRAGRGTMPLKAVTGTPEEEANCPVPTLEQCQDLEYLEAVRGCGSEQDSPDATCAALFIEAMDAEETEIDIVPTTFDPSGVDYVVKHDADPPATWTYDPDLFSFTSQGAARDMVGAGDWATDIFEVWRANDAIVTTCREYVFEKYYDVNEFLRVAGAARVTPGEMVDIAYGPTNVRSSIGSRHVYDDRLRGYDTRPFGRTIVNNGIRKKNAFFSMKNRPSVTSEGTGILTAPPLLDSLAARSSRAAALLDKIRDTRTWGDTVNESWYWHWMMSDLLRADPETPSFQGSMDMLGGQAESPTPTFDIATLGTTGGPGTLRRHLDKELDELYRMQRRVEEIQREWSRADIRFEGSGWTVENAGLAEPEPPGPIDGWALFMPYGVAPLGPVIFFDTPTDPPGGTLPFSFDIFVEQPETVIRRALLDELGEILDRADDWGCLDPGISPCDWSPQLFVDRAVHNMSTRQDRSFEFCNELSGGLLSNVLNLDVTFVGEEAPKDFRCTVKTGSFITAVGVEQLDLDVKNCRQKVIAYQEWLEAEEAKNRVRSIPELNDPATGQFRWPGIRKSRGERMGNDRIALSYGYDFGFGVEANDAICNLTVDVGGDVYAFVHAFSRDVTLLDAKIWASTETRSYGMHARVLGQNILTPRDLVTPVNETVAFGDPIAWNVGTSPSVNESKTIIQTTFLVVVVPVTLEVGVAGRIGANLGLDAEIQPPNNTQCPTASVGGLVEPFVGIDGYLSAALDIFVAQAGIRGDINIITISLPFKPEVGIALTGGSLSPENLELSLGARLDLTLSTLSGRIQAYVQVGVCPLCKKGERTIVEWEGPSWSTNLFRHEYAVSLGDLNVAFFEE